MESRVKVTPPPPPPLPSTFGWEANRHSSLQDIQGLREQAMASVSKVRALCLRAGVRVCVYACVCGRGQRLPASKQVDMTTVDVSTIERYSAIFGLPPAHHVR